MRHVPSDAIHDAARDRVIEALQTIVQFDTDVELRAAARARYLELTEGRKSSGREYFSGVVA